MSNEKDAIDQDLARIDDIIAYLEKCKRQLLLTKWGLTEDDLKIDLSDWEDE